MKKEDFSHHSIDILLVEDNPGDVILTKEAFSRSKLIKQIYDVTDGVEAMAYLRRESSYECMSIPDLILLDLNLPKMNGMEVLKEIKSDPKLCFIPVIILTTSSAEKDIYETYNAYANCYITKPVNMDEFYNIAEGIEKFWFNVVILPTKQNGSSPK